MRRGFLQRNQDVTGVSGTGRVLEIGITQAGQIVGTWLSDTSSCIYHNNLDAAVYVHSHNGASVFKFDGDCGEFPKLYQMIHTQARNNTRVGKVAEIIEFTNGKCVLNWILPPFQIEYFDNMKDLLVVHVIQNDYTQIDKDV